MNLREIISDSIKYWEPRRLIYNGVLGLVVIYHAVPALSGQRVFSDLPVRIPVLFALAIVANVLYSTAYVADVFIQLSDYRDIWRRCRWMLLALGTAFACVFAWPVSGNIFGAI